MDQAMHNHWVVAERRIDLALAGLVACVLWILLVPLFVLLTDTIWTARYSLALVSPLPIAVVFTGLLGASLRVVRAIEERDQDELTRWRTTLVAPARPDLLTARLRRVHYPMLGVITAAMVALAVVAVLRLMSPGYPAEAGYARGIALIAAGIALGVGALMLPVSPRAQLRTIVAVFWLVPAGAVFTGTTLMFRSDAIAAAVSSPTMTSFVFVILGILIMLVAITAAGFWIAWAGRMFSGRSLLINDQARDVPAVESEHGVASPEFDEVDVEIVSDALGVDHAAKRLAVTILLATLAILALGAFGYAGTVSHGVVAVVLSAATLAFIYRLRGAIRSVE